MLTPHAAFYTPESLADMRRLSMLAVVQYLRDGHLRSCVNLDELNAHGHPPGAAGDAARRKAARSDPRGPPRLAGKVGARKAG